MIRKHASAVWTGNLKDGNGQVTSESGVLDGAPYDFAKRFGGAAGTNPEELIGAAHAACFAMALSNVLDEAGITPGSVEARSTISLSMDDGPKVVNAHLDVVIKADGDAEAIMAAAETAKTGCPISQLLACEITMDAKIA